MYAVGILYVDKKKASDRSKKPGLAWWQSQAWKSCGGHDYVRKISYRTCVRVPAQARAETERERGRERRGGGVG